MPSSSVAAQLSASRAELLDLSFRNPLLNYRSLRAHGVEGINTDNDTIFDGLVRENKKMVFVAAPENTLPEKLTKNGLPADTIEDVLNRTEPGNKEVVFSADVEASTIRAELDALLAEVAAENNAEDASSSSKRGRLSLQTAYKRADLERRLLATQHTAQLLMEEQGVNTLFLAFGMLRWYEGATPVLQNRPHLSPLLLVPVELERTGAGERFTLRFTEEDIATNISLATYLEKMGLQLPPLPEAVEEVVPSAYFQAVENAVSSQPSWSIDSGAVTLAFFSFSKYLMYKELDDAAWPEGKKVSTHPLLSALLGDGFKEAPAALTEDDDLDRALPLKTVRTVMDADSSQMLAVEEVKQGRNLVIQGPPGTGKSQTITNVIAEALAQNKTVLFVAEKSAALQVVKSRLDKLGLGDACLELHSNKINKKAVLTELRRTLDLGRPVLAAFEEAPLLTEARDRLNSYCEIVNQPVGTSGLTLHHLYGLWLRHQAAYPNVELPAVDLPAAHLSWAPLDVKQREQVIRELQAHLAIMGVPKRHPFWGSARTVFVPTDADNFRRAFLEAGAATVAVRTGAEQLAADLHLPTPPTPSGIQALVAAVGRALEAPEHGGMQFTSGQWLARQADLAELLDLGERLWTLHQRHDAALRPEAWERDVLEGRQAVASHGSKWYRFLVGDWRKAQKELVMVCANKPPRELSAQLELLDALLEARRIKAAFLERSALGATLFGAQWQGERSNWPVLKQLLAWIVDVHREVGDGHLPKAFLDFLSGSPDLKPLAPKVAALRAAFAPHCSGVRRAVELLQLNETVLFGVNTPMEATPLVDQEARLAQWAANTGLLQQMTVFNHLAMQCSGAELDSVVRVAVENENGPLLLPAFQKSYYQSLLRQSFVQPLLANFSGPAHQAVVDRFRQLDTRSLQHNTAALALRHWDVLQKVNTPGTGEGQLRVLKREFEKRSRHLPVRQLLEKAGRVVQAVKPVFMMSPLSVAAFLVPGQIEFDLIVFDEASQVRPIDALGALARGKQAVVVGDSRQLPPTNFFGKATGNESQDDDNQTEDLESVLGLFASQNAPQRMLRWHYRSRHESLIAVSNREFYDNKLVIFPSPDGSRQQLGLLYRRVADGVYDCGGSGTNRIEARAVAQAVLDFAREQLAKTPSERLTLGVAAFSMGQMQAILDELELLRRRNLHTEPFFAHGAHESFFVKNLENVQGDERDVIFISVGYGRDKDGKVAMNFGPLNSKGGERRLNVLISRARLRCEVFTNLLPDDIDLSRSDTVGVKAFKTFLQYARGGELPTFSSTPSLPQPAFEEEIASVLRQQGYEVHSHVGCAGYFVDIAIVDPEQPGRYVLGIECDGPSYQSARSARDRDRLRDEVLQRMGWALYRIWSTDWLHRYDDEVRRLLEAVDAALTANRAQKAPTTAFEEPTSSAFERNNTAGQEPNAQLSATSQPLSYVAAQLPPAPAASIYHWSPETLAQMVHAVVAVESPVHLDEVARRIGEAVSAGRITGRFRETIERGVNVAVHHKQIRRNGDFLWLATMQTTPLRTRTEPRMRQMAIIAPEEIALALRQTVSSSFGISGDEAARNACRLLGFDRVTTEAKERADGVLREMVKRGELHEQLGVVSIP